jgi:hypothetical protein
MTEDGKGMEGGEVDREWRMRGGKRRAGQDKGAPPPSFFLFVFSNRLLHEQLIDALKATGTDHTEDPAQPEFAVAKLVHDQFQLPNPTAT